MKKEYDYIIVGSGLFGSIFAYEMNRMGNRCLVLEKRNHVGGNLYTEKREGINVHIYGAHIFHTSDEKIWNYVNKIDKFISFINTPLAKYKNELYPLPFNMYTFNKLWGVVTPEEAIAKIEEQKIVFDEPKNLEEWALSHFGKDLYEKLIYGYTCKQWGREPKELPTSIIKRLPLRFTYNNNYFNDTYQGVPLSGYTNFISKLLDGIEVKTNVDFLNNRNTWEEKAEKIIYTGSVDEFFNYEFGYLEYRSLRFEHISLNNVENYQGVAVVNYTEKEIPYTRIIEHKHFEGSPVKSTIISKEYPIKWNINEIPYYPINDSINNSLYKKYEEKSKTFTNYVFGGRLGRYKYYDMHQIVGQVLKLVAEIR